MSPANKNPDRDERVSFGNEQDPEAVLRALLQVDMDDDPDEQQDDDTTQDADERS